MPRPLAEELRQEAGFPRGQGLRGLLLRAADALDAGVVVVTRHPDFEDDISLHGVEARVVYIDLGSSFTIHPDDADQAREWSESVWHDLDGLPADHPARAEVAEVISNAVEPYFQVTVEGTTLTLTDQGGDHG